MYPHQSVLSFYRIFRKDERERTYMEREVRDFCVASGTRSPFSEAFFFAWEFELVNDILLLLEEPPWLVVIITNSLCTNQAENKESASKHTMRTWKENGQNSKISIFIIKKLTYNSNLNRLFLNPLSSTVTTHSCLVTYNIVHFGRPSSMLHRDFQVGNSSQHCCKASTHCEVPMSFDTLAALEELVQDRAWSIINHSTFLSPGDVGPVITHPYVYYRD